MNVFNKAIDLHTRWKLRLRKNIKEGVAMDVSDVGNCHACELGTWIYGDGLKHNGLASFEEMCSRHEHFHRVAAEAAQYANAGDAKRAAVLLDQAGEFEQKSLELMGLILQCSKELALSDEETCPIVTARDILQAKVDKHIYSIDADDPVLDALKMMTEENIGSIVVLKQGKFVGVFTERGFIQHISSQGTITLQSPVANAIDHKLVVVNKDSSLDHCMELMSATHERHVVVLDVDNVDGIISIADIIHELKTNKNYPYKTRKSDGANRPREP